MTTYGSRSTFPYYAAKGYETTLGADHATESHDDRISAR
jgi:hypothetical protein